MKTHNRRGGTNRGIYFLSTLIVAVMMAMLVMSAISIVRGNLGASRHLGGGDSALKAATSGLRYAQAKIGADPLWRGEGNAITVNTADLIVEEQQGNVIGIVRAPSGEWAQFRLRFNWQDDGAGDVDKLKDPLPGYRIDIPYVSVNNAAGGSPAPVPRADGPSNSVVDTSPRPYSVPSGTACMLVEGRSGRGLGDLGPGNLNPSIAAGGALTSKVIECYLRVNSQPGADAAAMAAGDVLATLDPTGKVTVDSKSGTPRVRSKKTIKVANGNSQENYVSDRGEAHSVDSTLQAKYDTGQVDTDYEAADADFYKLEWDDVKKAQPTDDKIAAGTYVLWDDGSLHYYDMNYQAYAAHIQANPTDAGTAAVLSPSMKLTGKTLQIKANTYVESTAKSKEFNLIPRQGVREDLPGLALAGTVNDQAAEFQGIVAAAPFIAVPGGQEKATWTIPLAGPLPSNVFIDKGNPAMGTGWNMSLVDNGNGTGRLILNDLDVSNLGYSVDAQPMNAFNAASAILVQDGDPNFQQLLGYISSGGATTMKPLNLPGISPTTTADQMKVEFKPVGGQSAILSVEGDVRLGSRVEGQGGSITSGATIRLVGAGSDLSANIEDGLNLYAKGDVVLSSLKPKNDGTFEYKSFKMKGVIYTWGDFTAKIGYDSPTVSKWGDFDLTGALVAYGSRGNPILGEPGAGGGGKITVQAKKVNLTFDAAYLVAFKRTPDPGPLRQTFFTLY